ncbi:SPFH domain-containing protein [Thermococcus sp.]
MVEVIEWVNPGEDEIVWRYPNEVIKWGAQLIVHEYEVAVFMRDGKIYDVLGPGRHTLTTQNLPLLYKLVGGSKSPFKATIIFVSTKQFQGRYGGETQTRELAPIKYYGVYWFKVADPVLFITEVVGGQSLYDASDVTRFIRAYFNEGMMKHLSAYSIVDLFQNLEMVSTQVKVKLMEDFRRLGLELVDVKIEGVNTTDEWRQRLFWLMQTGNAQAVMQMDTVKQVAAELGKSPGAGMGTGMVLVPQLFQQPAQPYAGGGVPPAGYQQPAQSEASTQPNQEICPYCGKPIPPGARFCPYCGKQIHRCPNGHIVPEGAKFCPVCGARIE